jgi:cyclic dehypoxanthinyl futalosine synthase
MGLEVAQIALSGGADDIGSTMMEENVVSASGTKKTMASIAELKKTILQSGFVPALRDSEYNILEVTDLEVNPLQVG